MGVLSHEKKTLPGKGCSECSIPEQGVEDATLGRTVAWREDSTVKFAYLRNTVTNPL